MPEYKEDIHDWFELTYAQYLAIPRTILQSMPKDWQYRFVEMMNELDEHFDWRRSGCYVKFKNCKGGFIPDAFCDYQRGRRILTQEQVRELKEDHEKLFSLSLTANQKYNLCQKNGTTNPTRRLRKG